MIYTIIIQSPPMRASGASSALKFAEAVLSTGRHSIYRIFLYQDGVHLANSAAIHPQDEFQINSRWSNFIQENNIDAVVCIAAALKRGILNKEESKRYDKSASVLDNNFELSGLGQLIDAIVQSDRVITFD